MHKQIVIASIWLDQIPSFQCLLCELQQQNLNWHKKRIAGSNKLKKNSPRRIFPEIAGDIKLRRTPFKCVSLGSFFGSWVSLCAILVTWCRLQTCILNKPVAAATISLPASFGSPASLRGVPTHFGCLPHSLPPKPPRGLMHFTFAVVSRYSFVFFAPKGEDSPTHTRAITQTAHEHTRIVAIAREIDFLNANALHMSDGMRLEKKPGRTCWGKNRMGWRKRNKTKSRSNTSFFFPFHLLFFYFAIARRSTFFLLTCNMLVLVVAMFVGPSSCCQQMLLLLLLLLPLLFAH